MQIVNGLLLTKAAASVSPRGIDRYTLHATGKIVQHWVQEWNYWRIRRAFREDEEGQVRNLELSPKNFWLYQMQIIIAHSQHTLMHWTENEEEKLLVLPLHDN